jgi:hypothetical protein
MDNHWRFRGADPRRRADKNCTWHAAPHACVGPAHVAPTSQAQHAVTASLSFGTTGLLPHLMLLVVVFGMLAGLLHTLACVLLSLLSADCAAPLQNVRETGPVRKQYTCVWEGGQL